MSEMPNTFKFANYVIFGLSEPVPADSLTTEQKEKILESMQDSYMASRGFIRAKDRTTTKDASPE